MADNGEGGRFWWRVVDTWTTDDGHEIIERAADGAVPEGFRRYFCPVTANVAVPTLQPNGSTINQPRIFRIRVTLPADDMAEAVAVVEQRVVDGMPAAEKKIKALIRETQRGIVAPGAAMPAQLQRAFVEI